jgi:hypothetical protein
MSSVPLPYVIKSRPPCTVKEGIIVFLDQQKAFDRVEWGWVDFVLKTFNFGEKFRGWIQMLVKNATTSIKTNGFVSQDPLVL